MVSVQQTAVQTFAPRQALGWSGRSNVLLRALHIGIGPADYKDVSQE